MKRRMFKIWGNTWRKLASYTTVGLVVTAALWWRLGSLLPGFSQPEVLARSHASTFSALLNNPIFLPHKVLQYLALRAGLSGPFWMRSASAFFGLAIVILFYNIVRNWYSRRIALMSSFLLLSSAWFLHFARLGTPEVMYATSIGLIWVGIRMRSARAPRIRTLLASFIIILSCMYVPGLVWMVVPLLLWRRKLIFNEVKKIPKKISVPSLMFLLVGLAPLVNGLVKQPSLTRQWLLLPNSIDVGQFWSNLWHLPFWLIWHGPNMPVYWLGNLPLFDIFTLVTLGLGVFVLAHYRNLDRIRVGMLIILVALVGAVLTGWIALTIALPVVFIIISSGIALLLQQWFTVFPRNPLARGIGVAMIGLVVLLSGMYNIRHYFVAWPRNSETKQVFDILDK